MAFEKKTKTAAKQESRTSEDTEVPAGDAASAEAAADTDALLDEIDGVLEANAEEFVKGYVQKGGQ